MKKIITSIFLVTIIGLVFFKEKIILNKNIAKVNEKEITFYELYNYLKWSNGLEVLLDIVDLKVLNELYPTTHELEDKVNEHIDNELLSSKLYYENTEEEFYHYQGYKNREYYYQSLLLEEKRSLLQLDFIKATITKEELENYYQKNVFGDIKCHYIFIPFINFSNEVEVDKRVDDILKELSTLKTLQEIGEKYKDITVVLNNVQTYKEYLEETIKYLKELPIGQYTKDAVYTTEGYYIFYKIEEKETPSLESIKESLTEEIALQKKASNPNSLNQALISMRKEYNFKLYDDDLQTLYQEYIYKNSKQN